MAQNQLFAECLSRVMSTGSRSPQPSEDFFPHGSMLDIHHDQPPFLPDQCFLEETDTSPNVGEKSYLLNTSMTIPRSQMGWGEPNPRGYDFSMKNGCYNLATPSIENSDGSFISEGLFGDPACPRSWTQPYDLRSQWLFDLEDSAVSEYLVHPPREDCMEAMTDGHAIDYVTDGNSREFSQLSISRSPTMESLVPTPSPTALDNTPTLAPSSKASEYGDDEGAEGSQSAPEDRISDEPYAKLIYRALLSAQDHRMALQEIYQWFIENTDKGSLTTSGWRNSIRHNLSMNAAFRKTDRRQTRDDTKKSSEWVLEPFAIKNGVTPTTRYRKNGKKTTKSENPDPVRVISGRKGGQQAGKTKSLRQKSRDDYIDAMRGSTRESRRRQSQVQHRMASTAKLRYMSPSTPTAQEVPNHTPYYTEYPSCDGLPAPDGVNGVFIEDEPLFYHNKQLHFCDQYPNIWANPQ